MSEYILHQKYHTELTCVKGGYFSLHSLIASFPACIKRKKSWDMYQVKIKDCTGSTVEYVGFDF